MREVSFELCAETLDACLAAREGGADRIELCSALSEDGLTPSHALIRAAVEHSGLPVYVLLRPRGGDFVYSDREFALMRDDLLHARSLGASGFALGLLRADDTVNVERTRELVALAAPLEVTFHRAFDVAASLGAALEDVIATGCRRVLTSGGACDVVAGATNLGRLVESAGKRIAVAAGGGLRIENVAFVATATRARHFHGSVRRRVEDATSPAREKSGPLATAMYVVDPGDVRALIQALRQA
ncbi:copper homeostasis protein CutC [Edaphobacter aggregans]|uniref:copper homeostasis protein CutC n=1 Tax=Edaphobacter aggregans TaxID=570835 RepID=UPI00068F026F|nr:copper homeostasis protein CutC [Edaphobacter aggregans]